MSSMQLDYTPFSGVAPTDQPEFPHPFYSYRDEEDGEEARTVRCFLSLVAGLFTQRRIKLVELQMCALSATLRSKPEWWRKYTDPDIRARWVKEALEQGLNQKQVDYVLAELAGYAALRDTATGIEVSNWSTVPRVRLIRSRCPATIRSGSRTR